MVGGLFFLIMNYKSCFQQSPSDGAIGEGRMMTTRKAGDLVSSPSEYQIFHLFRFENITGSKTAVSVCTL